MTVSTTCDVLKQYQVGLYFRAIFLGVATAMLARETPSWEIVIKPALSVTLFVIFIHRDGSKNLLALAYFDRSKGGLPRFDLVLMFKTLLIQALYNLSDERTEYLIDVLPFCILS